jgi:hypothetical protein
VVSNGISEELRGVTYALPEGGSERAVLRLTPLKDVAGAIVGVVAVLSPDSDGDPRA